MPSAPSHLDAALLRKTRLKFFLRRFIGEPYVGKRLKMRRLPSLLRRIPLPQPSRILEVGCEDGYFTEWLSRRYSQAAIEGLDIDAQQAAACEHWARRAARTSLHFRAGDILALDAHDIYDLILCLDVLGYIRDDRAALFRMAQALKPSGHLLIHQPNVRYQSFGGRISYISPQQASQITAGHVRHGYDPQEFAELMHSAGLQLIHLQTQQGRLSDLAHRIYNALEDPSFLRLFSIPFTDLLSFFDRHVPTRHGNTVFAIARRCCASSIRDARPQ